MKPKSAKVRHKRGRQGLTAQEAKKAVKQIAEGKSKEKVMVETLGYAPTTARAHPESLDRDPNYREAQTLLQQAIIHENPAIFKKLAKCVNEGLEAKKPLPALVIPLSGRVLEGSKAQKAMEAPGSRDFIEVPDHATRLRFAEFIARTFGQFKEPEGQANGNVLNVSLFFQLVKKAERERGLE